MPLQAVRGVLVTSDAATVVFLLHLNGRAHAPFLIAALDDTSIMVKADSVRYIREKLQQRLMETVFDEDETADQPMVARP